MSVYYLPELNHSEGKKYIIYGTGDVASQYCNQLRQRYGFDSVVCFLETNPTKSEFMNIMVIDSDRFSEYRNKQHKYIVTSFSSMKVMKDILISKGVNEDQIIEAVEPVANLYIRKDIDMVNNILFYPDIKENEKLLNLITRIKWYIPEHSNSKTIIMIMTNISEVHVPGNVKVISDADFEKNLAVADLVLVWDKNFLTDSLIKRNKTKVYCVDQTFYSTAESGIYRSIYFHCLEPSAQEYYYELSKQNYNSMYNINKEKNTANVFGTGPSLEEAYNFTFEGSFNIVCNSMVKNKKLLRHIKPDLLVFADPVFHFSPCEYSRRFREDVMDTIREFGCFCLIPDYTVPLILAHYPELEAKIIGMPSKSSFNFPSNEEFYTRSSSNILTLYMIPVASAISDDIYVLGCDGRQKSETYFWKHNDNTQYGDLMETAFRMHPSFFRDRVYQDYYDEHCEFLRDLIEYGEYLGKSYFSLTKSHIPVLHEREVENHICR